MKMTIKAGDVVTFRELTGDHYGILEGVYTGTVVRIFRNVISVDVTVVLNGLSAKLGTKKEFKKLHVKKDRFIYLEKV